MAVTSGATAKDASGPRKTPPGRNPAALGPETPTTHRPELRWRRVFPGHELQVRALRQWLAALLPECPARDDVISAATELGTNAVKHTASGGGGWFALEITWCGAVVRVAVADGGAPAGPCVIDDPMSEHGRGLLVVRELAIRTGVCGDHRGRLVWADIPCNDTASGLPAPGQDSYEAVIRDGQADLARRFATVPTWFGRSTLQWWALVPRAGSGGLVGAPSPQALAQALDSVLAEPQRSFRLGTGDNTAAAPADGDAPKVPVPPRLRRTGPRTRGMGFLAC